MNKTDIKDLSKVLETSKNIVIVSHRNPDGDAYGSSLALYHYLKKKNHKVTVISPNNCPSFLKWMPGQDEIILFEQQIEVATKNLNEAEVVFTLDFNAFHRTGRKMEEALLQIKPIFVMIDHHQEPDNYATYMYSDTEKCSTCEMVYDFIEMLGDLEEIDKSIASCLYTGIMTDTGSFRFSSTTSRTHRITADLLELGADNSLIYNQVMDVNSYHRMQLLGQALSNMKVVETAKTAYITLSQKELNRFKFQKGDTEGFVNHALSLKGIVFAVIFIEDQKQGIIKMSFRSKGTFSVNEFAKAHFNGGGHTNASGGRCELSLEETVAKFLKILPEYNEKLQHSYEI